VRSVRAAVRFTVADINMTEIMRYSTGQGSLISEYPATQTWLKPLHARPACQRIWAMREAETISQ